MGSTEFQVFGKEGSSETSIVAQSINPKASKLC